MQKSEVNAISVTFLVNMFGNAAHPILLMVPIFQQGDLDIGFTSLTQGVFTTLLVMADFQGKAMLRLS